MFSELIAKLRLFGDILEVLYIVVENVEIFNRYSRISDDMDLAI